MLFSDFEYLLSSTATATAPNIQRWSRTNFSCGDFVKLLQPYNGYEVGTLCRIVVLVDVMYPYIQVETHDLNRFMVHKDDVTIYKPTLGVNDVYRKGNPMNYTPTKTATVLEANALEPVRILKSSSPKGDRTIVFWTDGTKTIVKRSKDEADNPYNAFVSALAIKLFGSNSKLQRMIKRKLEVQVKKPKKKEAEEQLTMEDILCTQTTDCTSQI